MEPRITFITIAVEDIARAKDFYSRVLGWRAEEHGDFVFFETGSTRFGLYPTQEFLKDGTLNETNVGVGGFVLEHNVAKREEVNRLFDAAVAGGASVVQKPHDTDWGGYAAYFKGTSGETWGIAYNPFITLDAESSH